MDAPAAAACDGGVAPEAKAQPTVPTALAATVSGRLHVTCENFKRCAPNVVEQWVKEVSPVPVVDVFKQKSWGYAFISVASDDVDVFTKAALETNFRGAGLKVQEGVARKQEGFAGPPAKKRKTKEFSEGYVPTLKDLRDKDKQRKRDTEMSMLQKSAPLFEWPYETQLEMKHTFVKSAVRAFTKQVRQRCEDYAYPLPDWTTPEWCQASGAPVHCGCPLDPAIGTPLENRQGYRNKCEFTIGHTESGEVECGYVLRVSNGRQIISSAEGTPHTPAPMLALARVVRGLVRSSRFPVFDRDRAARSGVWRTVMTRMVPSTSEQLVVVQVAPLASEADEEELVRSIVEGLTAAADVSVVSIFLQINDGATDAARHDCPLRCIHGKPRLEVELLGLRFELGPLSFFQTNATTCSLLYDKALEWCQPGPTSVFLDVCCGVGSIGLCASRRCKRVVGLEIVAEAVESAKLNASLNEIENASFLVGKAEDTLPELLEGLEGDEELCAVVDPPRPGLHRSVLEALRKCQRLTRLVYVSCNPDSLVNDVVTLTQPVEDCDPFVPVRAVAVDMFPHTLHCEMVLLLQRASRVADPRTAAPGGAHAREGAADAAVTAASDE